MPGYDTSSIDDEALYVDTADNFKWKSKKVLRLKGVKSITYTDMKFKDHPPIVFDFENLKVSFNERTHGLVKLTKIYYVTTGGKLQTNYVTLFCIYSQYSVIMTQSFWYKFFTLTKMTTAEWGELSKKDKTLYDEIVALCTLWPKEQWWKLQALKPAISTEHIIPIFSNWV